MTAAPAIRRHGGGPLAVWVLGPVVGLAAVLAAFTLLPEHGCDRSFSLTGATGGIVFLAVAALATALAIGAGIWRFESLYSDERPDEQAPPPSRRSVLTTLLSALAVLVALAIWGGSQVLATEVFFAFILGGLATFVAFLMVAAAALFRRPSDEVGMALPVYLVGSGLFIYPVFVDLAASFSSGTWGC
jgi:hypothetical protein